MVKIFFKNYKIIKLMRNILSLKMNFTKMKFILIILIGDLFE